MAELDSKLAVVENRVVMMTPWVLIDYADTTAKLICWLPKDAVILEVYANVTTAFNDGTTDYLNVGDADTAGLFLANADVSSAAVKCGSQAASPLVPAAALTAEKAIYATYTGGSGDATEGEAEVAIMWAYCPQKELDS